MNVRRRVIHPESTTGVSPVVQDGIRDASVQSMVERLNSRGQPLPSGTRQPFFGDFTHLAYRDYQSFLNSTLEVREHFEALPSDVRAEFDNDPANLAVALDNPTMQGRMVELGFKEAPPPPPVLRPDPEANPHKAADDPPSA